MMPLTTESRSALKINDYSSKKNYIIHLANDVQARSPNGANVSCSTSFNDGENETNRLATTFSFSLEQKQNMNKNELFHYCTAGTHC